MIRYVANFSIVPAMVGTTKRDTIDHWVSGTFFISKSLFSFLVKHYGIGKESNAHGDRWWPLKDFKKMKQLFYNI